jgi:hypothetical protein
VVLFPAAAEGSLEDLRCLKLIARRRCSKDLVLPVSLTFSPPRFNMAWGFGGATILSKTVPLTGADSALLMDAH